MAIEKQVEQALLPAHQVDTSTALRAQRKLCSLGPILASPLAGIDLRPSQFQPGLGGKLHGK